MNLILSHESRVMLVEFLLVEKDATRVWLQAEMDRLVDPMLDSIFDRLQTKLTYGLERTQSGDVDGRDDHEMLVNHDDQLELSHGQMQSSFLIAQPSTSSHLMPQHQNVHHSYQLPNDSINLNESFNQHSELPPFDSNIEPTISSNVQVNFEVLSNEPTDQAHCPPSPTISNEQTDHNSNDQKLNDEEYEVCECDECVNGILIDDEEVKDDCDINNSVQWIEDKELSPKKPRMDSTQPNNSHPEIIRQSPRQPTNEEQPNQVNNQDKHIITLHLQCPELNCPDKFAENELTDHLMEKHSISPSHRCLVKDCAQSFHNAFVLGQHIKQVHQGIAKWHCDKCTKHYTTYNSLYTHNIDYHQFGQFQCSFLSCTFTGEYKKKVYDHYEYQHKDKPDLVCRQSGCDFRTKKLDRLKAHERVHLGIKPYRCKWVNCHYSNASQNNAMTHINRTHFNPKTYSDNVTPPGKPTDYLEVVHSLL